MLEVTLYTRPGCCLCEAACDDLRALSQSQPLRILEVDITRDPELFRAYFDRIPVLVIGSVQLEAPIDARALRRAVARAARE